MRVVLIILRLRTIRSIALSKHSMYSTTMPVAARGQRIRIGLFTHGDVVHTLIIERKKIEKKFKKY